MASGLRGSISGGTLNVASSDNCSVSGGENVSVSTDDRTAVGVLEIQP